MISRDGRELYAARFHPPEQLAAEGKGRMAVSCAVPNVPMEKMQK